MQPTNKLVVGLFVASLWLTASAGSAHAVYVFSESSGTQATHVLRKYYYLCPGNEYNWFTSDLTPTTADPVLHVAKWNGSTYVEVAWDDDSGAGNNVYLNYSPSGSSCSMHMVIVRAYDNNSGGKGGHTFKLWFNGSPTGPHELGRNTLDTGEDIPSLDTMETVFVNDGATRTTLWRFYWSNGHHKYNTYDISSGVGAASKLSGFSPTNQKWLVGLLYESDVSGPVRVIRNDVARQGDLDGDGLGPALEEALCTCLSASDDACGFDCSTAVTPQDSDGDGLTDKWEALRYDDLAVPQYLYKWGADPRHKDIFVEVDRQSYVQSPTCTQGVQVPESWATWIDNVYSTLNTVSNPDGTMGVNVHFDLDHGCTTEPGDTDGISKVCGQFGGASWVTDMNPAVTGWTTNMSSVRHHLFHWAHVTCWGTGQGSYDNNGRGFYFNGNSNGKQKLAHELGHTLNIQHKGDPAGYDINGAPHYPSLMNYAYDYSFKGSGENVQFSNGSRDPLNPGLLDEGTDYSPPGSDVSFLTQEPYYFASNPKSPRQFDWNRDGTFEPVTWVRAHIIGEPRRHTYGGLDLPMMIDQQNVPASGTVSMGPAAAYFEYFDGAVVRSGSWIITRDPSTQRYRYTNVDRDWTSWESWQDMGTQTFRSDGEPEAVVFDWLGDPHLYVFGVDASNNLKVSVWDAYGMVSSWATVPKPPGVVFASVETAVVNDRLYAFGPTSDDHIWYRYMMDPGVWYGSWTEAYVGANWVGSQVTPGAAAGPEGAVYLFVKGISGSPRHNELDAYVFDPVTDSWSHPSATWGRSDGCDPIGRPDVVFRPHLSYTGAPLPSGNGAFWIWWNGACGATRTYKPMIRFSVGPWNASAQSLDFGEWFYTPYHEESHGPTACHTDEIDGSRVGLLDHPDNLAAVVSHVGSPECPDGLYLVPYADGQYYRVYEDTDDGAVMTTHLCLALNEDQQCKCSNFNSICSGGTIEEPDWPDCEFE